MKTIKNQRFHGIGKYIVRPMGIRHGGEGCRVREVLRIDGWMSEIGEFRPWVSGVFRLDLWSVCIWMLVSKDRGLLQPPKWMVINNGSKPYEQMDDLRGKPLFSETCIWNQ